MAARLSYRLILADPPWQYDDRGNPRGGTDGHYSPMSTAELAALRVADLADPRGAVLYLWVVSPLLDEGIRVLRAWGFRYVTVGFAWYKRTNDGSCVRIGPGHHTRPSVELCLLGVRRRPPRRVSKAVQQEVEAPRQEHSRKPEAVHERLEELYGDVPRVELFARRERPGWAAFGDEVNTTPSVGKALRV